MSKYPSHIFAVALDMATTTGWSALTEGVITCGRENFSRKKGRKTIADDHTGQSYLDFEKWLHNFLNRHQPDVIFYEEAIVNKPNAARILYGYRALLMSRAAHFNMEVIGCHIGTIKKFATGRGNAQKDEMLHEAKVRHPNLEISDDNVADALHILGYGLSSKYQIEII